ncbi:MAG: SDR family oxidoreductase [Pseudonocardiales bacterium]|nr:SDR family oxidoreductase [Pseudonocardiales bacterium]MBV9030324.1 SDR family oxidoreductase [Pseudonocardiales bacterium]
MGVLDGKGAVVTGGSRGIGRAIVQRLAADGAAVVFNFARSADQAAEVEQVVRDAGGHARAAQIDLADSGAVDELMACADRHLDGFDILVNNAVLDFAHTAIADTSEELYDAVMTVNAKSAFLTMRHAARSMRDNGRIINISTLMTTRPGPNSAPYVASKGVVEQLTKVAAIELGGRGITVNVVCPGATDTELLRHYNPEATLERIARLTPLGRLGQPDDIADVVALLAGHDGRWLTGQIIYATGGLT